MGSEEGQQKLPDAIVSGYRDFFEKDFAANKDRFGKLRSEGQAPKAMWIGCADSRVPAERILGLEPGDLFVLRNVANIVPPAGSGDGSVEAAVAFGVETLKIEHIILCGHSDCGGIKALADASKLGLGSPVSSWIDYARPALAGWPGGEAYEELSKRNVLLQAERLSDMEIVRREVTAGCLMLHPCYFGIGSGRLERFDAGKHAWQPVGGLMP